MTQSLIGFFFDRNVVWSVCSWIMTVLNNYEMFYGLVRIYRPALVFRRIQPRRLGCWTCVCHSEKKTHTHNPLTVCHAMNTFTHIPATHFSVRSYSVETREENKTKKKRELFYIYIIIEVVQTNASQPSQKCARTFLPSSSCNDCANTLSTLDGSPNVMNPKPLQTPHNNAANTRKNRKA